MPTLERLLTELAQPTAYPHRVANLHIVQTHISCVFLTGDYAYKIKKPVDFGWLHYETLEQRRHFAQEELRLNRRLSPEIYEELVPIVERAGRLQVGGPGEPVEWAVRMRQLRDEDLLSRRVAAGTVPADLMERLAARLVEFHSHAATGPEIRCWGTAEAERALLDQALPQRGAVLPASKADLRNTCPESAAPDPRNPSLIGYLRGFWEAHQDLFDRRAAEDRVREGHGDLRLQNLCLDPRYQGGIQIFDCIEFNQPFRCLDVLSDLAYLAMDLDLHGRADLRLTLVHAYQLLVGDPDLDTLLPFFRCFRACIRAKIALLAAAEAEVPDLEKKEHGRTAAAALDLACSLASRRTRPTLWIATGLSGSGKSTLAVQLARRLPAVHLSSDRIRKEQAGVAPNTQLGIEWYAPDRIALIYNELHRRAAEALAEGEDVILDATYHHRWKRAVAFALAREAGVPARLLDCRCDPETQRRRLRARAVSRDHASDAGLAVFESQLADQEPPVSAELGPEDLLIPVGAAQSPEAMAHSILADHLSPAGG